MNRTLVVLFVALLVAGCAAKTASEPTDTSSLDAKDAVKETTTLAPLSLAVKTTGAYPVNPGFDPKEMAATAGAQVTVTLENAEAAPLIPHDWALEGVEGAKTKSIDPGQKGEITFTAPEAGTYKFFCTLGDHRERGMEGTFVVS